MFRSDKVGFGYVLLGLTTFCHFALGSGSTTGSLFKFLLARGSDPYMWWLFSNCTSRVVVVRACGRFSTFFSRFVVIRICVRFFSGHIARASASKMGPPFKLHLARGSNSIMGPPFKVLLVCGMIRNYGRFQSVPRRGSGF